MVVAAVVVIVIVLWLIAGAVDYNASGAATSPPLTSSGMTRAGCDDCIRLDNWWNTRSTWEKIIGALWYGAQKLVCLAKGC